MADMEKVPEKHHLVWIFAGYLGVKLSAASRLDTSAELRKMGWQVTLINICPCTQTSVRGIDVVCIPSTDVYFLRQMIYHIRAIRYTFSFKPLPDVIMFHQISAIWLLPVALVRKLLGKRTPLYLLDTRSVFMSGTPMYGWKGWLRGIYTPLMNRLGNWWVDGQTVITKRMAEIVEIPPDRLWGIWHSGVDLDLFRDARNSKRWPEGDEPVEVIYIGSMEAERHLLEFCQAVERVNAEGMNFHLTLIGSGLQQQELIEIAAQSDGRIQVFPPVPHEKVPEHLREAHIGVLPFPDEVKFRVSSPVKLFEYMAAGLVILATRISCHTDIVEDDSFTIWAEGATVDDLALALRKAWQARSRFREMSDHAVEAIQPFTWHESALRLKTALEKGLSIAAEK